MPSFSKTFVYLFGAAHEWLTRCFLLFRRSESQSGSDSSEGCIRVAGWLVSLSSVVPVLGHVVLASSCAASTRCMQSARHYHEVRHHFPHLNEMMQKTINQSLFCYILNLFQVHQHHFYRLNN